MIDINFILFIFIIYYLEIKTTIIKIDRENEKRHEKIVINYSTLFNKRKKSSTCENKKMMRN